MNSDLLDSVVLVYADQGPKGRGGVGFQGPRTEIHVFRAESEMRHFLEDHRDAYDHRKNPTISYVVCGVGRTPRTTLKIHDAYPMTELQEAIDNGRIHLIGELQAKERAESAE